MVAELIREAARHNRVTGDDAFAAALQRENGIEVTARKLKRRWRRKPAGGSAGSGAAT